MDYNQNRQYYSRNNAFSNHTPERLKPFSIASMICGTASIALCCVAVLGLPLGALGILFAVLSKRMGKPMPSVSVAGIVLSCTGLFFNLLMCGYLVFLVLTDPEYRDAFEDSYEYYYEEFYEYNFENLDYPMN